MAWEAFFSSFFKKNQFTRFFVGKILISGCELMANLSIGISLRFQLILQLVCNGKKEFEIIFLSAGVCRVVSVNQLRFRELCDD